MLRCWPLARCSCAARSASVVGALLCQLRRTIAWLPRAVSHWRSYLGRCRRLVATGLLDFFSLLCLLRLWVVFSVVRAMVTRRRMQQRRCCRAGAPLPLWRTLLATAITVLWLRLLGQLVAFCVAMVMLSAMARVWLRMRMGPAVELWMCAGTWLPVRQLARRAASSLKV